MPRKPLFPLLAAACALLLSAPAAAELSRAEVEKIVSEYIQNNPQEILDAVNEYQDRAAKQAQIDAIQKSGHKIYADKMTPEAGNPDGDVTLVEFFDYNCGYCKKSLPQILQLIEEDKNLRILFKEFPILGSSSEDAAKWALAAHRQDKYFEFHKALMNNSRPITSGILMAIAKDVGMDVQRARADVNGPDITAQVQRNRVLANEMEIRGTPAFIVGNEFAPGAVSVEQLKELIARARADKKKDG